MPTAIKIDEFPTATRSVKESPYRELIDYTVAYCRDETRRTTEGFAEKVADDAEFAKVAVAIRNAAKSVGAKVQLVYRDKVVHVRYLGEYVGLTDEQKQARAAARAAKSAEVTAKGDAAKSAAKAAK